MQKMSKTAQFIIRLSFITFILLLITLVVQFGVPNVPLSPVWPYILIFLYSFTLLAFRMLIKYINSKMSFFANAFMLVNFGKLFLFTIIIVVYAWFNKSDAISFTIIFFIYYFVMTTYEVIALLKLQKPSV